MVTVCTVLPLPERPRLDAAADGCFTTLHAASLRDALRAARRKRVDALVLSVHVCRGDELAGALILEMVGYRDPAPGAQTVPPLLGIDVPRTGDFLAAVGDGRSRELLDGFVAAARAAAPELPLVPYRTRLRGWLMPLTRLSDNASFWDAGYPSLMLTDTAFLRNPHYHQQRDTSATLDYEFMALVTEATAGAVMHATDAT